MDKPIRHLQYISEQLTSTLRYISGKKLNYVETLLYNLIERLRNTSTSLIVLLNEYEKSKIHEFSVGILIRPMLADALIGIYIYQQLENNEMLGDEKLSEVAFRERINIISEAFLCDGFNKTIEYAEVRQINGLSDSQELGEFYNEFVNSHIDFFDDYPFDGSKPSLKAYKGIARSTTALYKSIVKSDPLKPLGERIFDCWMYYSKYEHQSIATLKLLRSSVDHKNRIRICVDDFGLHAYFIHRFLAASFNEDKFMMEQAASIGLYIEAEIKKG